MELTTTTLANFLFPSFFAGSLSLHTRGPTTGHHCCHALVTIWQIPAASSFLLRLWHGEAYGSHT